MPYPIQLERKHRALEELFASCDCKVEPVIGMEEPRAYRAKIQSPFARGTRGKPRYGMYAAGSHELVECEHCLVEYAQGRPILETIAQLCQHYHIDAYDESSGRGLLRHAVIRIARADGAAMVTLVVNRKEFPHKKAFVADLRSEHPEIATVVFNVNTRRTNAVLGPLYMTAYGQGWIEDELCGCTFRIPAGAFYQTNPTQTEVLYDTAIEFSGLRRADVLLDAYCGIGTIGVVAARKTGCEVVGVESAEAAVGVAQENARKNHVKHAVFFAEDAGEFLSMSEGAPDCLIMDPPRAGASGQFMEALRAAAPERVVYISCNPVTQARDLELLRGSYRVERIVGVDMFPHTKHVECIASLSRL